MHVLCNSLRGSGVQACPLIRCHQATITVLSAAAVPTWGSGSSTKLIKCMAEFGSLPKDRGPCFLAENRAQFLRPLAVCCRVAPEGRSQSRCLQVSRPAEVHCSDCSLLSVLLQECLMKQHAVRGVTIHPISICHVTQSNQGSSYPSYSKVPFTFKRKALSKMCTPRGGTLREPS